MKSLFISLFSLCLMVQVQSQMIAVSAEDITINEKYTSAWTAIIDVDLDEARSSFISFAEEKYDVSVKKKNKRTLLIEKAVLPSVSMKQGDLWAVFYPEGDDLKIGIALFFGYDISVSSEEYPDEMQNLKIFTREYIVYYKSNHLNNLISEDEKRIKSLTAEMDKSQRELESLIKSNNKLDKSILKEEDDEKKFELTNKNIEVKANIQSTQEIIVNLTQEISRVTESMNSTIAVLNQLEAEAVQVQSLD